MSHAVIITAEEFADLRTISTQLVANMKANGHMVPTDTLMFQQAIALSNALIDIETRSLNMSRPLGATENIGSCEPEPMPVRWDKTQKTWHVDVGKVGRYSVRRTQPRGPYAAYLNGKQIDNVGTDADADVIRRRVETRIYEARRINKVTDAMPFQSPLGAR